MSKFLLLFISIFTAVCFIAQEYNFQYLTQSKGLDNTFINGITQDDRGYLFIATGEGMGIYDGSKVTMYTEEDHLVNNYVSSVYKDKNGHIWLGHIQGGSSIFYEGKFGHVFIGAGVEGQINDITEDNEGRIWFVSQSYGLYYFTEESESGFIKSPITDRLYYSLYVNEKNHFFIGTDKGIEVYEHIIDKGESKLSKIQKIGGIIEEQIASIILHNGHHLMAISISGKVYTIEYNNGIYSSKEVKFHNLKEDIIVTEVKSARGHLWFSTLQNGLMKCIFDNDHVFIKEKYNSLSGLKTDAVNSSFVDREGVLWIGTFGEGLASKEDDLFTYYFVNKKGRNPYSSVRINSTNIYAASEGKIYHFDKQNVSQKNILDWDNGLPKDEITSMIFDKDSNLYVGTTLNGVYRMERGNNLFEEIILSKDLLSKTIADIEVLDSIVYIATLNGVYEYTHNNGVGKIYNITSGLPHNSIQSVFKSSNNDIYIATNSAFISKVVNGKIVNYPISDGTQVVEVNDIYEDIEKNIWFCSNGHGIFQLTDSICINYNTETELATKSNYCNSMRINSEGDIWISHNEGMSKINIVDSISQHYGSYYGIEHRFLRGAVDIFENEIWFGTDNGLVMYNKGKDINNMIPPITSIKYITINDSSYANKKNIELPYGNYKFAFGLSGLTLKGAKNVTYRFMLEGYDKDWSFNTNKTSVYYTQMTEGSYTFKVKAYNADGTEGNIDEVTITIAQPYWKKWWFFALISIGTLAIIYGIIKYRERSFVKYQEKLKSDLALRTREVVKQKNKIEQINKDLTDSINYAQRIQNSILPSDDYLINLFPKSFVFFRPRDIVSGDFYWCGEVEDKQIIVCADCTGHGVPGGFMSMISHILLREGLTKESINNPALILNHVNRSINDVLKQTDEINSNHDGLDIAIIVQDLKNSQVKFAGAMRPLYLYRKGVRTIIKGDRHSLGGLKRDKIFETKLIDIQKGDKLYIFSDGYADQFGGERKSKMKLKVFQEYLDQVSQLEMNEQSKAMETFLDEWRNGFPQMDDILVIGIEI